MMMGMMPQQQQQQQQQKVQLINMSQPMWTGTLVWTIAQAMSGLPSKTDVSCTCSAIPQRPLPANE